MFQKTLTIADIKHYVAIDMYKDDNDVLNQEAAESNNVTEHIIDRIEAGFREGEILWDQGYTTLHGWWHDVTPEAEGDGHCSSDGINDLLDCEIGQSIRGMLPAPVKSVNGYHITCTDGKIYVMSVMEV